MFIIIIIILFFFIFAVFTMEISNENIIIMRLYSRFLGASIKINSMLYLGPILFFSFGLFLQKKKIDNNLITGIPLTGEKSRIFVFFSFSLPVFNIFQKWREKKTIDFIRNQMLFLYWWFHMQFCMEIFLSTLDAVIIHKSNESHRFSIKQIQVTLLLATLWKCRWPLNLKPDW